jgi:flagellar biosynthetic protein FlhB
MAGSDRDQRTEKPTPKRLSDAARKGDVLQSRDLATAIVLMAGLAWCYLAGSGLWTACLELVRGGLSIDARAGQEDFDPLARFAALASPIPFSLGTLLAATMIGAVAAPSLLGSFGFRSKAFTPQSSRIDPFAGFRRIFGAQGLAELLKSLAKASVLGLLGLAVLNAAISESFGFAKIDLTAAVDRAGRTAFIAVAVLTAALGLIACIDVPIQIFQRRQRLMMTKHEMKEELRQTEGSIENKQQIRRRQIEILSMSDRKAIAEATVVLTNPSHFAVALRYVPGTDAAPMVIARARDEAAQAIKAEARQQGVPALEYPQLTRAIYFSSRAGQIVSKDLYLAVATILAFVFSLRDREAENLRRPDVSVPDAKRFDSEGRREVR